MGEGGDLWLEVVLLELILFLVLHLSEEFVVSGGLCKVWLGKLGCKFEG